MLEGKEIGFIALATVVVGVVVFGPTFAGSIETKKIEKAIIYSLPKSGDHVYRIQQDAGDKDVIRDVELKLDASLKGVTLEPGDKITFVAPMFSEHVLLSVDEEGALFNREFVLGK